MVYCKNSISDFYLLDIPYYLFQTPCWVCQLSIFKKFTPVDPQKSPSEKIKLINQKKLDVD